MITVDDISAWLSDPAALSSASADELLALRESYPFCEPTHWLLLRKLSDSGDIRFSRELARSSVHISDRRALYNYLHYEPSKREDITLDSVSTLTQDYFAVEGNEEHRKTLQQLAARLKAARMAKKNGRPTPSPSAGTALGEETLGTPVADVPVIAPPVALPLVRYDSEPGSVALPARNPEDEAKHLIKEKRYSEALQILKTINLNNPKKSAYFALQIKYLETILSNNK